MRSVRLGSSSSLCSAPVCTAESIGTLVKDVESLSPLSGVRNGSSAFRLG